jgi:hypothetical protein
MVAPEPKRSAPQVSRHSDLRARAAAAHLASRVLSGDVGLLEALPQLHDLLYDLGEFDQGEFVGDMAPLSFMLLDLEPYLCESGKLNENAARWVPTLVARHRAAAIAACQRIVDRYSSTPRKLG